MKTTSKVTKQTGKAGVKLPSIGNRTFGDMSTEMTT